MSARERPDRRTALVTGAGGFLGGHLVDELLDAGRGVHALYHDERSVRSPSRPNHHPHVGDVADEQFVENCVRDADPDCVYHLAAKTSPGDRRATLVETNVVGTNNVFEAAAERGVERVVYASSAYRYADAAHPKDESAPLAASNVYGASKRSGELLADAYVESEGLQVAIAVPFLLYGPGQAGDDGLIPAAVGAALDDEPFHVRCENHVRDPVFVADAADALRAAGVERLNAGRALFNVCTGVGMSVRSIVESIYDAVDADARPTFEHRATCDESIAHLVGDPSHAADLLGWEASTSWEDGLRRTIEAYRRENGEFA